MNTNRHSFFLLLTFSVVLLLPTTYGGVSNTWSCPGCTTCPAGPFSTQYLKSTNAVFGGAYVDGSCMATANAYCVGKGYSGGAKYLNCPYANENLFYLQYCGCYNAPPSSSCRRREALSLLTYPLRSTDPASGLYAIYYDVNEVYSYALGISLAVDAMNTSLYQSDLQSCGAAPSNVGEGLQLNQNPTFAVSLIIEASNEDIQSLQTNAQFYSDLEVYILPAEDQPGNHTRATVSFCFFAQAFMNATLNFLVRRSARALAEPFRSAMDYFSGDIWARLGSAKRIAPLDLPTMYVPMSGTYQATGSTAALIRAAAQAFTGYSVNGVTLSAVGVDGNVYVSDDPYFRSSYQLEQSSTPATSGVSDGAVAGIAIASAVGAALLVGVVVGVGGYVVMKRRMMKAEMKEWTNSTELEAQSPTRTSSMKEATGESGVQQMMAQ